MIWRKIKMTAEEKQSPEWPYSPEEMEKFHSWKKYNQHVWICKNRIFSVKY